MCLMQLLPPKFMELLLEAKQPHIAQQAMERAELDVSIQNQTRNEEICRRTEVTDIHQSVN